MPSAITMQDIANAAAGLRIDPALLAAVLEVECGWPRRSGLMTCNGEKRPRILWERHICWRRCRRRLPRYTWRKYASACSPVPGGYPKRGCVNWDRLERIRKIVGDCAYDCASYGLPQIMGFNHRLAGYSSAKAMVAAFMDEREQLRALGRFLRRTGLLRRLRRRDWHGFARGYNGPAYHKHNYHLRLARSWEKWRKKKWPRPQPRVAAAEATKQRGEDIGAGAAGVAGIMALLVGFLNDHPMLLAVGITAIVTALTTWALLHYMWRRQWRET